MPVHLRRRRRPDHSRTRRLGEVTDRSAVVWARSSAPAEMVVDYGDGRVARARSEAARDFTARVKLENLEPGTRYRYRVHFESDGESSAMVEGSFRTAPSSETPGAVKFVVGGDLGGHGFCRDATSGYSFFDRMRELGPDFFIANGDMIYADSDCPEARPDGGRNVPGDFPRIDDPAVDWTDADSVREIYLAHWRYNRADPSFQRFLLEVPVYSQWDDHEVINDFGAPWPRLAAAPDRQGYPVLVRAGREALFDFHPLWPNAEEPERIYRSFRWGAYVELFLLDARSYRSANDREDSPEAEDASRPRAARLAEERSCELDRDLEDREQRRSALDRDRKPSRGLRARRLRRWRSRGSAAHGIGDRAAGAP